MEDDKNLRTADSTVSLELTKSKLKELIEGTKDTNIKHVINQYDPDGNSSTIYQDMYTNCLATHLKTTAKYLNYGTPVDYKKPDMTNWIISRIENFLPQVCSTCQDEYCVEFGHRPALECFLCHQGIHDECYKKQIGDREALPKIIGLHWLCGYCEPRATTEDDPVDHPPAARRSKDRSVTSLSENTMTRTDSTTLEKKLSQDQVPEDSNPSSKVQILNLNDDAPTNTPSASTDIREQTVPHKEMPICIHYKRGKCRHGLAGTDCKYRHPKQCRKYMAHGDKDKKRGCTLGNKCENFHPRLCKNSIERRECLVPDCRFIHLKGTRRTATVQQSQDQGVKILPFTPTTQAPQPVTPNYTFADAAKMNLPSPQADAQQINSVSTEFTTLLKSIQDKLLFIEKQQHGQTEAINGLLQQQHMHQGVQYYYPTGHQTTSQPVQLQQQMNQVNNQLYPGK